MSTNPQDKHVERDRYDQRAQVLLAHGRAVSGPHGAAAVPLVIRRPYVVFEEFIRKSAGPGKALLDVCCGTGLFSLIAADAGADVTATDIAENNLVLTRKRAAHAGLAIKTVMADAEHLPFANLSFDLVTCAGSLSYLDPKLFLSEVERVLRPGGWFICVDSLSHNPIYRFNRFLQYLRGRRSRSTLVRMPTLATIARLHQCFEAGETSFHGSASFLAPVLRPLFGENRTARWLDRLDERTPISRRWSFKFVFRGRRKSV